MLLIAKLLHKGALLINTLQVLNNADFLSTVDLLIVLEQLCNDLFKHGLLCNILRLWHKGVIGHCGTRSPIVILRLIVLQGLIVKDLLKDLELICFFLQTLTLIFRSVDADRRFESRDNVLCLPQEVQRKLILQQQEKVHVDVELLESLLIAVTEAT